MQRFSEYGVTNNGTCRKHLVISLCVEYIICIEEESCEESSVHKPFTD